MSCSCKLALRGIKTPSCLMFGIIGEIAGKYPAYTPKGVEYLPLEEGEALIEMFSKQGLVHSIWFHPKPFIGMLCNCGCQDCVPIKNRLTFNTQGIYKGHYVAKVDLKRCIGCQAMPCKSRCIFSALYFNPTIRRTQIDMANCFGCGLCIRACPENAISLVSREEIPGLRDMW